MYCDDLAVLYRLVIEKRAEGIFHGVDGASPSLASVARAVSAAMGKGGETSSLPVEEARAKMGLAADALCTDQLVVTKRSAELGWRATHPTLDTDKTLDTDSGVEAAVAKLKREVGAWSSRLRITLDDVFGVSSVRATRRSRSFMAAQNSAKTLVK